MESVPQEGHKQVMYPSPQQSARTVFFLVISNLRPESEEVGGFSRQPLQWPCFPVC